MSEQEQRALDALEREVRFWRGAYYNERNRAADLQHHLRDRDAHIKNLEEQLRPHLLAEQPETEAML